MEVNLMGEIRKATGPCIPTSGSYQKLVTSIKRGDLEGVRGRQGGRPLRLHDPGQRENWLYYDIAMAWTQERGF